MRTYSSYILTAIFLGLAATPWLISSCSSRPLMPNELQQAPVNYELTVEASQVATIDAQRQQPSTRNVVAIGTVAVESENDESQLSTEGPPTATAVSAEDSAVSESPPSAEEQIDSTQVDAAEEATAESEADADEPESSDMGPSEVTILDSAFLTQTVEPTPLQIVVTSNATPAPTSEVAIATVVVGESNVLTDSSNLMQTQVMTPPVELVEDLLTEQMIAEQLLQDVGDLGITDMVITLTPDGIVGFGSVSTLFGLAQDVRTEGNFLVENESLKVDITSILLGNQDVTAEYSDQLADSVNSSLYRLLPQRYVQGFEAGFGEVRVQSEIR